MNIAQQFDTCVCVNGTIVGFLKCFYTGKNVVCIVAIAGYGNLKRWKIAMNVHHSEISHGCMCVCKWGYLGFFSDVYTCMSVVNNVANASNNKLE